MDSWAVGSAELWRAFDGQKSARQRNPKGRREVNHSEKRNLCRV